MIASRNISQLRFVLALLLVTLFFSAGPGVSDSFAQSTGGVTSINGQLPGGATLDGVLNGVGTSGDPATVSFTASETDVSIGLLQAILGNWKSNTMDPTTGALFRSLNLAVLVFGSCLFLYVSTIGVLHSAEDGEVLGKKWGSIFVPLRMAAGMAMLFPLANGFSTVQIIVLWLATNGVGVANWTMEQTLDSFVNSQGNTVTAQLVDAAALSATMGGILRAEACVAELNWKLRDPENPSAFAAYGGPFVDAGTGSNSYGKVSWGLIRGAELFLPPDQRALVSDASIERCGSISIPSFNSVFGVGNGTGTGSDGVNAVTSGFSKLFKGADLNNTNAVLRRAHFDSIVQAAAKLRPTAVAFVSGATVASDTTLAATVGIAALEYRARIADALNNGGLPSTQDMSDTMLRGIKTNGWATLGVWYYQFARIGSELSKMTSYAPQMSDNLIAKGSSRSDQEIEKALDAALKQSAANPATVAQIKNNAGNYGAGNAQGGISGGVVNLSNRATNNASQWLGEAFGVDPSNKLNAMMQLKNVGDNILSAAEIIYIGKNVVSVAATAAAPEAAAVQAAVGSSSGLTGFMGKVVAMFTSDTWDLLKMLGIFAGFAMLSNGMLLAFWIPMVPFILFLGAVTGWIIAVLEMVVAAPMWAAAHLHPEGEGMSSRYGASGYMIIVEVFAKPVLMVAGFFIAARFVDPFLRFSSGLFFNNMATVNADSVTGILTTIAFVFMYLGFCCTLVNRSFTLIHVIPNSVLRWIGGGGDRFTQVGDIADEMGSKVESRFGGMTNKIEQALMGGAVKNVAKNVIGGLDGEGSTDPRDDKSDGNN